MDENVIVAAHHEAGHALMAHIVGWGINSIILKIEDDILIEAVTNYNFNGEEVNSATNFNRRILCLMGGPVAQAIHENRNDIDIDSLGRDGELIDFAFSNFDVNTKVITVQYLLNTSAELLNISANKLARERIVEVLLSEHQISPSPFLEIVEECNVVTMNFN